MRKMRKYVFASIIAMFALTLPLTAFAAMSVSSACSAEIAKYCKDVPATDQAAVKACLQSHKSELSKECQQALQDTSTREQNKDGEAYAATTSQGQSQAGAAGSGAMTKDNAQFMAACGADVEKYCKGQADYSSCLNANKSKLSSKCTDWMKSNQQKNK